MKEEKTQEINELMERQIDRQRDRQTDRLTERQIDKSSEQNLPSKSVKFGYYLKKVILKSLNQMSQIIEICLKSAYVLVYKELML